MTDESPPVGMRPRDVQIIGAGLMAVVGVPLLFAVLLMAGFCAGDSVSFVVGAAVGYALIPTTVGLVLWRLDDDHRRTWLGVAIGVVAAGAVLAYAVHGSGTCA